MNRTALCIKMLMYLKANGLTNTKTLASVLETNPRNIREYKNELITAGYDIQEVKGRYGGYFLNEEDVFPALQLTQDEIKSVQHVWNVIKNQQALDSDHFENAMVKVLNTSKDTNYSNQIHLIGIPDVALSDHERKMLHTLLKARQEERMVRLTYRDAFGDELKEAKTFILYPYEVCLWNNAFNHAYYVMGYKQNTYDHPRTYRISDLRMLECELLDTKFVRDTDFHIERYVSSYSLIKRAPTRVCVRVKSENVMHDTYWGTNVEQMDKDVYSFEVEDLFIFYSQIFFKRNSIEILEPKDVRNAYKDTLKEIMEMYGVVE